MRSIFPERPVMSNILIWSISTKHHYVRIPNENYFFPQNYLYGRYPIEIDFSEAPVMSYISLRYISLNHYLCHISYWDWFSWCTTYVLYPSEIYFPKAPVKCQIDIDFTEAPFTAGILRLISLMHHLCHTFYWDTFPWSTIYVTYPIEIDFPDAPPMSDILVRLFP